MADSSAKNAARVRVAELVQSFQRHEAEYLRPAYNETQARTDFITPMLEAFGWDVHNNKGLPLSLREVVEEATVEVGEERSTKKPDYELRLARERKLFVEAKKPSVKIDRDRASAFQTRRYGFSASLPIAVLTNFYQLAVYDCLPVAFETEDAHVARRILVRYDEFESRFDELWDILSREVIYSGEFDRKFAVGVTRHGSEQFDDYFLRQVREWRLRLASDIQANTPGLSPAELTYAVQLYLSRIVFLRICEDRDIEKYETLKDLDVDDVFADLMKELERADDFYNSGLFRLSDDASLGIRISDATLVSVIRDLYYPQSPYTFAVVETEVLGQIYEQFLGEEIVVSGGLVELVSKPEVRDSGGIVPTPRYLVEAILERTLGPAIEDMSPTELTGFTVADICCGSGVFLLSAYERLLDHYLAWYLANDPNTHVGAKIYEAAGSQWRLTYEEKRRILLEHIRGVDIDPNAVEVARFSLLLKLIEDETKTELVDFVERTKVLALPELDENIRCGNSLVSQAEWEAALDPIPVDLLDKINPFTWRSEFPQDLDRGGFDVIVGNPPYIRIQNMATYSPEEVGFYQDPASPYSTARQDNFDKYALFIERALTLLQPSGRLGVVVPHKFMTIQSGRALRRLLARDQILEEVVHFGVKQVFGPNTANYTCILILDRGGCDPVRVERVEALEAWRYGKPGILFDVPAVDFTEEAWQFIDTETRILFQRVKAAYPIQLGDVAEIFVGLQTSADSVYIFKSSGETPTTMNLHWDGRDWPIERGILRPCLHDVQLSAYATPQPNAQMIFPYEIIPGSSRATAQLIQPTEMASRFPGAWAYLNARRTELERRSIAGGSASTKQWYQFGRSQNLTKFDSPKVILQVLSTEPRYTYDDTNIAVTGGGNGPYYMVRPRAGAAVANYFLLAVLNHPLSEAFIRTNTSTFQGGYYSHGRQFIENLPVPTPSDAERTAVETLTARLIDVLRAVEVARTPHERMIKKRQAEDLKRRVENHVTNLFGLSEEDMAIVRAVPLPI